MKKKIFYSAIICYLFSSLLSGCINGINFEKGNGNIVKKERAVKSFNSIDISGSYNVYINQDSVQSVFVEADENLQPLIITKVEGAKLIIENEKSIRGSKKLKLYITTKDINDIDISGSVKLICNDTLKEKELEIDVSGSGNIEMNMNVENLILDCSGSGDLTFSGKAENVKAEISGASDINAFELIAENFKLSSSGAVKANIYVNKMLDVSASGTASVHYKGNPAINQKVSGVGSVKKEN